MDEEKDANPEAKGSGIMQELKMDNYDDEESGGLKAFRFGTQINC